VQTSSLAMPSLRCSVTAAVALAGVCAAADATQFKLAWANGGGMRVAWRTADAASPSQCSYGTMPSLGLTASGTSKAYLRVAPP
jgi:hypothetical protein